MRKLLAALCALSLFYSTAWADCCGPTPGQSAANPIYTSPAPNAIQSTNAIQSCGPYTTTLNAAGQIATMPAACNSFATYFIHIVTTPGQAAFVGTIQSSDSVLGSTRRLIKNGVADLQVSSETLTGSQGNLDYRTTGGPGAQSITVTAYTSGSIDVTLYASTSATAPFVNGAVDTPAGAALRQGKAFTVSSGLRTVAANSNEELLLSNPAGSGVRLVIPAYERIFSCDNVSSAQLPKWTSLPSPTTNLPSTAITPTRRGGTTGTSLATAVGDVLTTTPSGGTGPTFPVGGAFFGAYVIPQDRTLEPGSSLLLYITGVAVPTGLTSTNSTCSIIISWFEESLN